MTATIDAEPQIIKTDTRGRVQTSPERREQLLAEFERSGLSAPKFAALVGIKYPTFAAWAARRRRQQPAGNPAPPGAAPPHPMQWLEAVVTQAAAPGSAPASPLTLHLPGGARLTLTEPHHVGLAVALLRALDKPC